MKKTHVIIDAGTPEVVALPIAFVTDTDETSCSSDLEQFKSKCNPQWGWDEAKKVEVFNLVMAEVKPTNADALKGSKKPAPTEGSKGVVN